MRIMMLLVLFVLGLQAAPTAPKAPAPAAAPKAPAPPAVTDGARAPGLKAARPNFVFIQAEAQGWSSTSVDMDGVAPSTARPAGLTPNLEKMAADGMRFSDFYVSCPRCTPSRASWVTGIGPA